MAAKKKGITKVEQDAIDDIKYIKSKLNDRVATYSGLDRVVTEKIKKRIERQKHHLEREEINPCKRTFEMINLEPGTSSCEDESIEEVTTIAQSRKHRRLVKCGIDIFVPHDILKNPDLVSCSIRNNISSTQLSAIVHSLVAACGGDLYKLCLNPRTAHRCRTAIVDQRKLDAIAYNACALGWKNLWTLLIPKEQMTDCQFLCLGLMGQSSLAFLHFQNQLKKLVKLLETSYEKQLKSFLKNGIVKKMLLVWFFVQLHQIQVNLIN